MISDSAEFEADFSSKSSFQMAVSTLGQLTSCPAICVKLHKVGQSFAKVGDIQGAVKSGGQFAYVPGMTVRAAVSTAGGYSDTANRNRVTIYRSEGGQVDKADVDLDFPVEPGDTIVVAERWL